MRLKVLSIPRYFDQYIEEPCVKLADYPVFGFNARYRLGTDAWYEYEGQTYVSTHSTKGREAQQHIYDLSVAEDKRISQKEMDALKTLITLTRNSKLKKQLQVEYRIARAAQDRRRFLFSLKKDTYETYKKYPEIFKDKKLRLSGPPLNLP